MPTLNASPENIDETLRVLCRDIGNRLAASAAEREAAEYVAGRMRALGLSNVTIESFPFDLWGYEVARVEVPGPEPRVLPAIPVANSPATPEDGLEAEVVYVDHGTAADLAMHDVEEKLLLVWGPHGGDRGKLQALQDSGCVGVLWVDDRFPVDWPVSIGTPFDWRHTLRKPQLCIAYWDGLRLAQEPGQRVRMFSDAWSEPGESVNVFGDLPGAGEEFVHIGAHIDSVVVGVGAEDDGSGIAAMLEAARMLAELGTPERTIRFCGFGAEEQLSEGARRYVAMHPDEVAGTRVMLNLDSMAAITGRNQFMVAGPEELMEAVRALVQPHHQPPHEAREAIAGGPPRERGRSLTRGGDMQRPGEAGPGGPLHPEPGTGSTDRGSLAYGGDTHRPGEVGGPHAARRPIISGEVMAEVTPFSDMFPFSIHGVPSVFFHRMNQAGTRYFHHSHLDDLQSISSRVIAMHANALAHLAHQAAFGDPPYERAIPEAQMAQVRELAARYFGL